jgi:hypothetical protein
MHTIGFESYTHLQVMWHNGGMNQRRGLLAMMTTTSISKDMLQVMLRTTMRVIDAYSTRRLQLLQFRSISHQSC